MLPSAAHRHSHHRMLSQPMGRIVGSSLTIGDDGEGDRARVARDGLGGNCRDRHGDRSAGRSSFAGGDHSSRTHRSRSCYTNHVLNRDEGPHARHDYRRALAPSRPARQAATTSPQPLPEKRVSSTISSIEHWLHAMLAGTHQRTAVHLPTRGNFVSQDTLDPRLSGSARQ